MKSLFRREYSKPLRRGFWRSGTDSLGGGSGDGFSRRMFSLRMLLWSQFTECRWRRVSQRERARFLRASREGLELDEAVRREFGGPFRVGGSSKMIPMELRVVSSKYLIQRRTLKIFVLCFVE